MSSISSVTSNPYASAYSGSTRNSKAGNASAMAEDLFAQLDPTGKGYIEKSDLANAFSSLSSSSTASESSASVDEVFSKFDGDNDGKVTENELASGLESLASALDDQFNMMRMNGAMPPPPPQQQDDAGFTQDELTQQLSEISSSGSTDSARAELMSKIVANFDAADTNGDGKVSNAEAMAYAQSTSSASSTSVGATSAASSDASNTSSDSSSSGSSDLAILKRVMDLMHSYASSSATASSTLSVSA